MKFVNYDIVFQEIPNEITLAINISNCPNCCPDCHSKYLVEDIGEVLTEDILESIIDKYRVGITCIAFMGGDASPDEVGQFAQWIKEKFSLKVAWYSGKERIYEKTRFPYFDYIKIGPFRKECGALKEKTTNQRFYKIHFEPENNKVQFEDITSLFWK